MGSRQAKKKPNNTIKQPCIHRGIITEPPFVRFTFRNVSEQEATAQVAKLSQTYTDMLTDSIQVAHTKFIFFPNI